MGLDRLLLAEYVCFFKVQTLSDLHAHTLLFEESVCRCPRLCEGGYGPVSAGSADAPSGCRVSPYPTCGHGTQYEEKQLAHSSIAGDFEAHLEKARLAVQTAWRTPAGNPRKKSDPLALDTEFGHSVYTLEEIRKTLTHVKSLQPSNQMSQLKRCWEMFEGDKRLKEQEKPLILSNEHTAAAAELLRKFPKCTPYDYSGGRADSQWKWFNVKIVKDEMSGTEHTDISDEIEMLARVILYFQEIEKFKKGRTMIRGSRIRCMRNGLRQEDYRLTKCKDTGHIWHKVFRADDAFRGRIDDGHIVLAGLHLEYLPLKRVEQGDGTDFNVLTPSLHFDKTIKRFKGWA